jgi:DNA-binding NarL/FixJ family response regulator
MKNQVDILIVEDSKSYAQGMELLLLQHPLVNNVNYASNYEIALETLKKTAIQVVLLDLNFQTNQYDGFVIAKKIRQQYPEIKIIVLTQHTRKHHYKRLIDEKLSDAYLDKQLGIEETFEALDVVLAGQVYVDKNILEMMDINSWMRISKREQEVLDYLVKGKTQKETADILCISPKTVAKHIRNLMERFNVKNTTELVAKYIKYKNGNRENIDGSTPPFLE